MFEFADGSDMHQIALLLLPEFALGEVGLLIDAVDEINQTSARLCYQLTLLSLDGAAVASREGRAVKVDASLANSLDGDFSLVAVMTTAEPKSLRQRDAVLPALNRLGRKSVLAGVHAGAFWLAAAGMLNGYRATVHWSMLERFSQQYPGVISSNQLFEVDRDRVTCGGGLAIVDLLFHFVARQHGNDLNAVVAENLLIDHIRRRDERQRIPLRNRLGANQPILVQAVMLMEANLEEPLTAEELAAHVGVSRRHLERLFKQYLDKVPSQYYMEIRLHRARQMLRQSSISILQVALSCGFSTGQHFSNTYRYHFDVTPREDRQNAVHKIDGLR